MFQVQNQVLRPQITAHLAQTMSLLAMTKGEIQQKVNTELANNPALEMIEERRCPSCGRILSVPGPCPICSQPYNLDTEEPIVFLSPQDDFSHHSGREQHYQDSGDYSSENFVAQEVDLATFVLQQIAPDLEEDERLIAAHILSNLDDDGILNISLGEISRFLHVPHSKTTKVAKMIRGAKPLGVGASSPREALLAQVEALSKVKVIPNLTEVVINSKLELLSKRNYIKLAKELNTSQAQVQKIADFIRDNLTPYPARANWGNIHHGSASSPAVYHNPDVIIREQKNSKKSRLIVEIITPYRGTLRINPLFRQALKDKKNGEWKSSLEQASLLIKCLQQRNNTMEQLMGTIAKLQREFLLTGDKADLRPTTQAEMAERIDVHESTISRAVSAKSAQLPNKRIVPLKIFFDRSLPARVTLRRIVEAEKKPLSDSELAEMMAEKGHVIARRTVAKYRSMEGILSSRMRK